MRYFHTLLCFALILGMASCASVKEVAYAPALEHPRDAHPAPIGWSGMKVKLPTGQPIGTVMHNNTLLPGCGFPISDAHRSVFQQAINSSDIEDAFKNSLEGLGYDIVGTQDFQFPEDFEDELMRAEYKVGARVTDVQMSSCYETPTLYPLIYADRGYKGKFYMKLEWSLYDALRREVVYKTTSEGYADLQDTNPEGITLMITEAFTMATHNLGADQGFHDLVFYGSPPADNGVKGHADIERPRIFNPDESVRLTPQSLSTVPFTQHAEQSRKAAVMIQSGAGHGSGFFISKDGYLLTNAHVVGDALRVRVVTADKEQAMPAEVLRKNKMMDVALLKLEEKPDFPITVLPIRTEWPAVSETVYAIGTPLTKSLQDTVSQGIISAHRKNYKINGARMDLLQADVQIHGGNSGGPLLDQYGNIIGLSDASRVGESGDSISLNFFVPIGEALKYLEISLSP